MEHREKDAACLSRPDAEDADAVADQGRGAVGLGGAGEERKEFAAWVSTRRGVLADAHGLQQLPGTARYVK
ncbi:hypothetical protein [Streptomyces sp. TLI_105]|uniref:hypothetical protein n=1 Tax=Streptomyces sp. TLI_105 TaxID=1881019 RepID=UPI00089AA58E|nr:hypothetical protein [Streptomyces sp. TLI_105]SEC26330.1 hypothetical protein SAMN05428939_1944 [Streptomyces sp. TLI_105]